MKLTLHPADRSLRVAIEGDEAALSPEIEDEVNRIWQAEKQRTPSLFDGPLFSIRSVDAGVIRGEMTHYRRFIAQRRRPELADRLRISALGVTGLHRCRDGIVFCRRAKNVEMDAERWELSPAGSVDGRFRTPDGIDLATQLLEELVQETGITAGLIVEPPSPFARVEDGTNRVTDIGMLVLSDLTEAEIRACFERRETAEYDAIAVVPERRVEAFADEVELAPVSRALLRAAGSLI